MTGIERIAAERQRQIDEEGWTPEHDDQHRDGELARAGASYAFWASLGDAGAEWGVPPSFWPWGAHWWKPSDPIRGPEKAGALIAAEIDRLLRLSQRKVQP